MIMADQLEAFRSWVWDADFWLPENSTWEMLDAAKNPRWVKNGELYLCYPVAIILIILRFLFERFIAGPIVRYLGVKDKPVVFVPNTFCEKVYQTISKEPSTERLEGLSKQLGWPSREVKKWFRNRRQQSKPSLVRKATESSWRFVFYLGTTVYGFAIAFKEPWLWDLKLCFVGHGRHPLTDEIYYYYLVEIGFYVSLLISLVVDVKRKDFWQMVVHHIVTILLTTSSYTSGYFRIGAVIMLLHDMSDIFLEFIRVLEHFWNLFKSYYYSSKKALRRMTFSESNMSAKIFNYAKWEKTCEVTFVAFAIVFNVARLVYYPFWVIHMVYFSPNYCGPFKAWSWFIGLLLCLQVLHFYWSFKICEMAYQFFIKGEIVGDVRSDEESGPEEEKAETNKHDSIPADNKKKQ